MAPWRSTSTRSRCCAGSPPACRRRAFIPCATPECLAQPPSGALGSSHPPPAAAAAMSGPCASSMPSNRGKPPTHRSGWRPWSDLMRGCFAIDVQKCPRCSGRMKLRALVTEAPSIQRLLRHLGEPTEPPKLSPAPVRVPGCATPQPGGAKHGFAPRTALRSTRAGGCAAARPRSARRWRCSGAERIATATPRCRRFSPSAKDVLRPPATLDPISLLASLAGGPRIRRLDPSHTGRSPLGALSHGDSRSAVPSQASIATGHPHLFYVRRR